MLKNKIIDIFGEKGVLDSKEDLAAYSYDSFSDKDMICLCTNAEQIFKLVKIANRYDLKIYPAGSMTSYLGKRKGLTLDMARMNHIYDTDIKNTKVIVQSSLLISDLNKYLKRFKLEFPIIPYNNETCTLGSIFVRGYSEKIKKYIENIEVIDGSGKHFKSKDIAKFFGSDGKLAIITKFTLLLSKIKEPRSLDFFYFSSIDKLFKALMKITDEKNLSDFYIFDNFTTYNLFNNSRYSLLIFRDDDEGRIKNTDKIDIIKKKIMGSWFYRFYNKINFINLSLNKIKDNLDIFKNNRFFYSGKSEVMHIFDVQSNNCSRQINRISKDTYDPNSILKD